MNNQTYFDDAKEAVLKAYNRDNFNHRGWEINPQAVEKLAKKMDAANRQENVNAVEIRYFDPMTGNLVWAVARFGQSGRNQYHRIIR